MRRYAPFPPLNLPAEKRMDATNARCSAAKTGLGVALLAVVLAGTGCVAVRPADNSPPSSPPLQLLSAGELDLPSACTTTPGAVYRTLFEVQTDGTVSAPRSAATSDDGCVQHALREWVATFTYAPLAEPMPVAFDWMAVTASRH